MENNGNRELGGIQAKLTAMEKIADNHQAMLVENIQPRLRAIEGRLSEKTGASHILMTAVSIILGVGALAVAWFK